MRLLGNYTIKEQRLQSLAAILLQTCGALYGDELLAVFVFGSYATGRATPESDLDILIVVESSEDGIRDRCRAFRMPEHYAGPEIQPIIYTRREFMSFPSLLLTLTEGNVILYSKDSQGGQAGEAEQLLHALQGFVEKNGIERIPHKGGYYWRGIPLR